MKCKIVRFIDTALVVCIHEANFDDYQHRLILVPFRKRAIEFFLGDQLLARLELNASINLVVLCPGVNTMCCAIFRLRHWPGEFCAKVGKCLADGNRVP